MFEFKHLRIPQSFLSGNLTVTFFLRSCRENFSAVIVVGAAGNEYELVLNKEQTSTLHSNSDAMTQIMRNIPVTHYLYYSCIVLVASCEGTLCGNVSRD